MDGLTEKELEGIARQALNLAQTDRELRGWQTSILLATYYAHDIPPLRRMETIEQLLREKLGERWLDSGAGKDAGFGMLRRAVGAIPNTPDAVVIVTPTNMFRPTAKMRALPAAQQKRMTSGGHADHHRLAAQGYFEVVDSFTSVAQTPERVCIATQVAGADGAPGVKHMHMLQEHFGGRLKMFGKDPFEDDEQQPEKTAQA